MPVFNLTEALVFPPVHLADPEGVLAVGGDLTPERLLLAYRNGIFPWYQSGEILWWSPDPRFILFTNELKIDKAIKKTLGKNKREFTTDRAFSEVIWNCKEISRPGQDGTWITPDVEAAYIKMHALGYAQSAELWENGKLIGGLYGIRLGKVFFGESMFSRESGASRIAFTHYVQQLSSEGVELIDCQVYTEYLESFGAKMIPRKDFLKLLSKLIPDQNREPR